MTEQEIKVLMEQLKKRIDDIEKKLGKMEERHEEWRDKLSKELSELSQEVRILAYVIRGNGKQGLVGAVEELNVSHNTVVTVQEALNDKIKELRNHFETQIRDVRNYINAEIGEVRDSLDDSNEFTAELSGNIVDLMTQVEEMKTRLNIMWKVLFGIASTIIIYVVHALLKAVNF